MRKLLLCGALAAATAIPALAQAQPRCVNPRNNSTTGAIVGAAGGALIGSQLAGRHDRGTGAVLGALGGALVGGAVGSNSYHCPDGYYREEGGHYYDNSGSEYRYEGPPPAAYAPPPPPPAYGPGPSYSTGPSYGPGPGGPPPGGFWEGAPERIADRIAFTEEHVRQAEGRGWIDHRQARMDYRQIASVRTYESDARSRNGGRLRPEDRQYIMDKLNYIGQRVHWEATR